MRPSTLRLEFAPGARRPLGTGGLMLVASGLLLCAALLGLGMVWSDHEQQQHALEALEPKPVASASRQRMPTDPADAARSKVVRQVAQYLATPWADLLDTLESARTESVALLSVEPSVSKRNVRLTAEARNWQDMLTYLGTLQRDPRLSSVVLVSHQVQLQSPGIPVRFQIQAGWGALP